MKYEVKDLNAPSRWNMRIWDDNKKEWLCQSDQERLTYYGFDITGGETTEFQGLPKWYPDRHLIWEQSTGLKDKNSKEIYEGDIVFFFTELFDKGTGGFYGEEEHNAVVEWFDNGFAFMDKIPFDPNIECEVIGNIHENPELLRGKE